METFFSFKLMSPSVEHTISYVSNKNEKVNKLNQKAFTSVHTRTGMKRTGKNTVESIYEFIEPYRCYD